VLGDGGDGGRVNDGCQTVLDISYVLVVEHKKLTSGEAASKAAESHLPPTLPSLSPCAVDNIPARPVH